MYHKSHVFSDIIMSEVYIVAYKLQGSNNVSDFALFNHRHIFLFDAAVIVCKRRGDNYEMKEVIDLHLFKITNNPTSDKENRKVCTHMDMVPIRTQPCLIVVQW